jgi:hypothetical protein
MTIRRLFKAGRLYPKSIETAIEGTRFSEKSRLYGPIVNFRWPEANLPSFPSSKDLVGVCAEGGQPFRRAALVRQMRKHKIVAEIRFSSRQSTTSLSEELL